MKYEKIEKGIFVERPNRFVAHIITGGEEEKAHVRNTGRFRELLLPGTEVYLEDHVGRMGNRKLRYSLIGVRKGDLLINMDSQMPNKVTREALCQGQLIPPGMGELTVIKPEKKYGSSRLDFYVEDKDGRKGFIEVKGVTLEEDGVAQFPDAPTMRGIRHLEELIAARKEGYHAFVLFVIAMKGVKCFMPNDKTHQAFGDALRKAKKSGVILMAYDCRIIENGAEIRKPVEIKV